MTQNPLVSNEAV